MKFSLSILLALVFAAPLSAATNRSSSKLNTSDTLSLSTIKARMGLIYNLSNDSSATIGTSTSARDSGAKMGVSLGIQDIKTRSIGYIANLSYLNLTDSTNSSEADVELKALELSATYGIQDNVYILAGFNRTEIDYSGTGFKSRNAMQFGFGYNFNQRLNFELKRREAKGESENTKLDIETIDLNINYIL